MPVERKYFSASSGTSFVECPAKWITSYDEDRNVRSRNDYSDVGSLIHGALERWIDPANGYNGTFEELKQCFDEAAVHYTFAEPIGAFKRAGELLAASYALSKHHPTIPIEMLQTISVEQGLVVGENGDDWQMDGWDQPARGQLDRVGIIPALRGEENEIILFLEDYKTGRPKTHTELVEDDIQPPLYFLYGRDVLVPWIESQIAPNGLPYKVVRIVGSWTYIGEGMAVALYEADFDHEITHAYIANLMRQMQAMVKLYNDHVALVTSKHADDRDRAGDLLDVKKRFERVEDEIAKWLVKYEKPNSYCSYCPRKNQCQTFTRLLAYDAKIDLTGPDVSWDAIYEEYVSYQAKEKDARQRVEEIKSLIPVYLDQEKLQSIPLANGKEFIANSQNRKRYNTSGIAEILGVDFLLKNATVTTKAIEAELNLIAATNPTRARQIEPLIKAETSEFPYSRPVLARNIESASKRKAQAKK